MQLTYRGVVYSRQSNQVQLPESRQTGIYRGQTFNLKSAVRVLRLSSLVLTYRGVQYSPQSDRYLRSSVVTHTYSPLIPAFEFPKLL